MTLQSRCEEQPRTKLASKSSQTDWSLQPSEPFLFIATNHCDIGITGKDKLHLRADSETETDEGEHGLDMSSLDNSAIPEILRTDHEFVLANHKYILNENSETLAAIQSIAKDAERDNFLGDNCNEFFINQGEDDGPKNRNPAFGSDMGGLLVGAGQMNFSSDNLAESFSESLERSRALGFSSLEKMMSNDDIGQDDESQHLDNIVNDIVVDLINNNNDNNNMKQGFSKKDVGRRSDGPDFNLDFDYQSKPYNLSSLYSSRRRDCPDSLDPGIMDNISMYIRSENNGENPNYVSDTGPQLGSYKNKDIPANQYYPSHDFSGDLGDSSKVFGDLRKEFFPNLDRLEEYENKFEKKGRDDTADRISETETKEQETSGGLKLYPGISHHTKAVSSPYLPYSDVDVKEELFGYDSDSRGSARDSGNKPDTAVSFSIVNKVDSTCLNGEETSNPNSEESSSSDSVSR